jgi:hypothetical protein
MATRAIAVLAAATLGIAWYGAPVHADCSDSYTCADTSDSPGRHYTIKTGIEDHIVHSSFGTLSLLEGVPGAWVHSTIAPGDFPSATLDSLGNLVVSYYDVLAGDLKVGTRSGGVWSFQTIDAAGRVGLYSSIARVVGGLAIAYSDSTKGRLKYAERIGGGAWAVRTVDSSGIVGQFASMTARGSTRGISYYDASHGDLRFAIRSGGVWTSTIVDSADDVGGYTSQRPALSGYGVAYYDFTNHDLKYAWMTSGPWHVEGVSAPGDVGMYASAVALGALPGDSVGIAYYDKTHRDLRYAQKVGVWGSLPVDTAGDVGVSAACIGGPLPGDTLTFVYVDDTSHHLVVRSRVGVRTAAPGKRPAVSGARVDWSRSKRGPGGTVRYTVPSPGPVELRLFDPQGRVVKVLIRDSLPAGADQVSWDGRDLNGRLVASGVLYLRIDTASGSASAPAVLLR